MLQAAAAPQDVDRLARYTRYEEVRGRRIAESSLRLGGIDCAACGRVIEQALRQVGGVESADVNTSAMRACVRWDPERTDVSAVFAAIEGAGYQAAPDVARGARALRAAEWRQLVWRLFVAAFCAMQVMMLAAPAYLAGTGELAPDLRALLARASWLLTLPVIAFSATPFFAQAWRALRLGRITMDVPVALGVAVCFVASSVATFDPAGPLGDTPYFDSLGMFVAFLLAGRALEMHARHRAEAVLDDAVGALPETARRVREDGGIEEIAVQRLAAGDRVQVALGDAFPADGVVEQGTTEVDESLLTGESRPAARTAGDAVVAGSLNVGAPVTMRAERVGPDTRHERIVSLVREAAAHRPDLARAADAVSGPFLVGVLVLAAAAGLAWQAIDPARAAWVVVSVLIVTCPCALSLATPAAVVAATSALARRGVLLRRPQALEALARVRHVFLDKTGTLTQATPRYAGETARIPMDTGERLALRDLGASLAAYSRHPLAQALVGRQATASTPGPAWREVAEHPGLGLQARDPSGQAWRFGRYDYVLDGPGADAWPTASDDGPHAWFGPVGEPRLRFDFEEALAPGAVEALAAWRRAGVRTTLLSGDSPGRVRALAARLHIDEAIGGASPQDKLAAIASAQARGACVAMIGDGINDAPVLARADVSFAMGHSAALARGHSDAIVASSRIDAVAEAAVLARRLRTVVRQNLAWAVIYNAACVPLAIVGLLPPWAAGMGMAASSAAVVLNALRLAR